MAFLGNRRTTAAVIARSEEVQTDEIMADDLLEIFDAFPRPVSRFYMSAAVALAVCLRHRARTDSGNGGFRSTKESPLFLNQALSNWRFTKSQRSPATSPRHIQN
jgi:hypothetical protein